MAVLSGITTAIAALMGADKGAELAGAAVDLLSDGGGKKALEWVDIHLRAYRGGIPPNHDLEHALRLAELTTSLVMVETYRREEDAEQVILRSAREPPFVKAARSWLHGQIGLSLGVEVTPNDALIREIEHELDSILAAHDPAALRAALADVETRVWNELAAGALKNDGSLPPEQFKDLFFGHSGDGKPGWSLVFQAFVREAMKDRPRAQVAFITTRLAGLRTAAARMEASLDTLIAGQRSLRDGNVRIEQILLADAKEAAHGREVADGFIHEIAGRIGADPNLDMEDKKRAVRTAINIYVDEIVGRRTPTNLGDIVDRAVANARRLAGEGKSRLARASLRKAVDELRREEQERRALRAQRVTTLYGFERDIALATHDGQGAASAILEMAEELSHGDFATRRAMLVEEADRLKHFDERQKSYAHQIAVIILRRATLSLGTSPEEIWSDQNNLGDALQVYGSIGGPEVKYLREALVFYRSAQVTRARQYAPLDWATMQHKVGATLLKLGESNAGKMIDLEEAVIAFRMALEERTRKKVPHEWSKTQKSLGDALYALGVRENGTESLEEAIIAYRAALEEWPRELCPSHLATIHEYLGHSFAVLWLRDGDKARLEEALVAYRMVPEAHPQKLMPLKWALDQRAIGNTLWRLGELETGTSRLKEALVAWDEFLANTSFPWRSEWVEEVRQRRDAVQLEIERREQN